MSLFIEVTKTSLELVAQYTAYDHIANLAFDLGLDPYSLLTFGLTALTVSQLIQNLPAYKQCKLPLVANTSLNDFGLWTTTTSVSAVFAKCVTDNFTNNPISWFQASVITVARFVIVLTHSTLLNLTEEYDLC